MLELLLSATSEACAEAAEGEVAEGLARKDTDASLPAREEVWKFDPETEFPHDCLRDHTLEPDAVKLWLTHHPRVARERDQVDENLLLHVAVINATNHPLTIALLLDAYPEAAALPNKDGMLPLHLATCWGANHEVVGLLLEAYPAGATAPDPRGRLPLHMAVQDGYIYTPPNLAFCLRYHASHEVVSMLLQKHPSGPSTADNGGRLPLHKALESKGHSYEDAQRQDVPTGATDHDPNLTVVKLLLEAYPLAAEALDSDRWAPLHVYMTFPRAIKHDVVVALIEAGPEAVCRSLPVLPAVDQSRPLYEPEFFAPLHAYLISKAPEHKVVAALLDAWPWAARGALHWLFATKRLQTPRMLRLLIDADPRGAKAPVSSAGGITFFPLHLAIESRVFDESLIRILLHANPESAGVGPLLPLHRALVYNAPLSVLKLLLAASPSAASEQVADPDSLHDGAHTLARAHLTRFHGSCALHFAMRWTRAAADLEKLVRLLLPKLCATTHDCQGRSPLRVGLARNKPYVSPRALAVLIASDMPIRRSDGEPAPHKHSWTIAASHIGAVEAVSIVLQSEAHGGFGFGEFAPTLAALDGLYNLSRTFQPAVHALLKHHGEKRQQLEAEKAARMRGTIYYWRRDQASLTHPSAPYGTPHRPYMLACIYRQYYIAPDPYSSRFCQPGIRLHQGRGRWQGVLLARFCSQRQHALTRQRAHG